MSIKTELKNVVEEKMLPEVELYIEDLHELLKAQKATNDDMNIIKDMESFMVELQNVLEAIDQDMISDVQAQEVYDNFMELIDESNSEEEIRA